MQMYYIYTLEKDGEIFYVGKTNNIQNRLKSHRITYGDVKIEILSETYNWREEEKYWISQLKIWGFNLINKNKGGGGESFKSEKTKKAISLNQPKNKNRNPQTNIKIGLSNKGLKKKPCSEERKEKIRKANIGKKFNLGKKYNTLSFKKVIQYDMQGTIIKEWDSVKEILLFLNKKQTNDMVYRCCQDKIPSAYGFIWKYKKN